MLFLVCNSSQVENHLDFAEQEHSRSGQSTAAPRETLRALALMTAFTLLSTLLISAVRPRQRQKLWKRASCAGVASATHHPANARTQPLAAAARTALIHQMTARNRWIFTFDIQRATQETCYQFVFNFLNVFTSVREHPE